MADTDSLERIRKALETQALTHPGVAVCDKADLRSLLAREAALREALAEERRIRLLGQEPDVHWESLRDVRRAAYAATDAALASTEPT